MKVNDGTPTVQARRTQVNCSIIWRDASRRIAPIACAILLSYLASLYPASAQSSERKVKSRTEPVYPDLARRNNITGTARVELLVAPDGKVKDVKVLGGNPVLVQAVISAVLKWKYEPATQESSIVVKFEFTPKS
jgi:TonB family protein